jgi:hypothetical protein
VTGSGRPALTVTFAGSGDAFGSGGRYQACIHLDHLDEVSFETAHDGLVINL